MHTHTSQTHYGYTIYTHYTHDTCTNYTHYTHTMDTTHTVHTYTHTLWRHTHYGHTQMESPDPGLISVGHWQPFLNWGEGIAEPENFPCSLGYVGCIVNNNSYESGHYLKEGLCAYFNCSAF